MSDKPKINPEFLEALDHFGTLRLHDGPVMPATAHIYVTRNSKGGQTPWTVEDVCRLAHEILDTEQLNYLKLKALKAGLKKWGAEYLYEQIMGEQLK